MSTDENRFHALKFAAQTLPPGDPGEVIRAAQAYLHFLEGGPTAPPAAEDVELADLTESYPADEPVIAMADSPVEEELFEPHPPAMTDAEAEAQGLPTNTDQLTDWLSEQPDYAREIEPSPEMMAVIAEAEAAVQPADLGPVLVEGSYFVDNVQVIEAPTEAEITAAVEQIADPAPVIEDASEQPEMTDEQVERTEDRWRAAADQIGAAEHEPEKELEPVGAHMRFAPWFATRK